MWRDVHITVVKVCLVALALFFAQAAHSLPWECLEAVTELDPDVGHFSRLYLAFHSDADNVAFIEAAERGFPPGMVFFHVENAVLKPLNDELVRNKFITGALEALYTKLFFENLKHAGLQPKLVYSDYKTIRLGFEAGTPNLEVTLANVHRETALHFETVLQLQPQVGKFYRSASGLASHPIAWHMAGIGRTPDEAATSARLARQRFEGKPHAQPIVDFRDAKVQEELSTKVTVVDSIRSDVQRQVEALFGRGSLILGHPFGTQGEAVLSREAIDILRRYVSESDEEFLSDARRHFVRRFDLELGSKEREMDELLLTARAYLRAVDTFAPSIYERTETMDLGLASAQHGAVMVDLSGQNSRNIFQTMVSLRGAMREGLSPGETLAARAVALARHGQDLASRDFDMRRKRFNEAIEKLGLPGELLFSGDDGLFKPSRPLTLDEKVALGDALAALGTPGDYRLSYLPPHYEGETEAIPPRKRAGYLAAAETLEKKLRIELEGKGIPFGRWKGLLLGMDLVPNQNGNATLNLVLSGRFDDAMVERVREACGKILPAGLSLGVVRATPLAKPIP